MLIPSRDQCLSLMKQEQMPLHIRNHSLVVTEVALYLARLLNRNGTQLNLKLIESAGLLHDIAKMRCIKTGENHARLGAQMLRKWGYFLLAPIVEEHILIDPSHLKGPLTESLIVNYADKRVKHEEIVSLEDRFEDLAQRYGKTPQARATIQEKLRLYLGLEEKIFDHLTIEPDELLHWTVHEG
jgi:putative nucleotidyltransferase with HDIG domain